jgi:hypothetical protein
MTNTEYTQPTTAHTPEPWSVDTADCFLITADADGGMVAVTETLDRDDATCSSNARHIVAAVKACKGIGTEALEQGAVASVLAALAGCLYALDESMEGSGPTREQAIARARDALTLARAV